MNPDKTIGNEVFVPRWIKEWMLGGAKRVRRGAGVTKRRVSKRNGRRSSR